ncbi:hypothetical protein ACFQMA_17490 [Halosimplex aquaticum]|uniref:Uncharacterized protein n=1 Tax=Halosimplex aquaticum TaxID=3026162 RepID=A0ABD5Y2K5_9EURY|nr:hypothetical protein [Halosimplex aquaticum]
MSDESRSSPGHVTRRGALALGGAAFLAGCGVPGDLLGSEPVELDGPKLRLVTSREGPTVPRPFPVEVAGSHVTASRDRAYAMLDAVPLPLTADEMANGAMRDEIAEHAERARSRLSEAIEAPSVRERLERLADARGSARVAEGTWAAANDELSAAAVRANRRTTREAIDAFRENWAYVGDDDVVRALLVHDLVEEWAASARTGIEPDDRHVEGVVNALVVGERAGSVEGARATLADAEHVGQRFRESLSDARSLRSTFADARDSLSSTIESRMADVPPESADLNGQLDANLDETVAGFALKDLHGDLPTGDEIARTDGLAVTVLGQIEGIARLGAFETLYGRIESGDHRTVEGIEDVEALRAAAVTAVEDALAASADDRLARTVLATLSGWFDYAERQLSELGDSVELSRAARDLALYVALETIAAATPAAVDEGLAALGVE